MGEVVVMKSAKSPQQSGVVAYSGGVMCKWSQVTPLLGLYLDARDNWRLSTGEPGGFRGYAMREGDHWVVSVWCASGKPNAFRLPNRRYTTEGGAVRALERLAASVKA